MSCRCLWPIQGLLSISSLQQQTAAFEVHARLLIGVKKASMGDFQWSQKQQGSAYYEGGTPLKGKSALLLYKGRVVDLVNGNG